MLVIKQFQFPLTSIVFFVQTEVNGQQTCLVTHILPNMFFYVPQKKVIQVWKNTKGSKL